MKYLKTKYLRVLDAGNMPRSIHTHFRIPLLLLLKTLFWRSSFCVCCVRLDEFLQVSTVMKCTPSLRYRKLSVLLESSFLSPSSKSTLKNNHSSDFFHYGLVFMILSFLSVDSSSMYSLLLTLTFYVCESYSCFLCNYSSYYGCIISHPKIQ